MDQVYQLVQFISQKTKQKKTLCSYAWPLVLDVLFIIRFVMLQRSFTLI